MSDTPDVLDGELRAYWEQRHPDLPYPGIDLIVSSEMDTVRVLGELGYVVVDADTLAALAVDHTGGWCPQRRSHEQHCGDCTACAHRALVERARALLEGGNHD